MAEVRPLPAGGNETDGFEGCGHGCWKRVSGVGGLSARRDWGAWRSMENAGGERPEEATCKEDCAVYHIESWWNAYEEVGPRAHHWPRASQSDCALEWHRAHIIANDVVAATQ